MTEQLPAVREIDTDEDEAQEVNADDDDLLKKSRSMVNKLTVMVNGYAVDRNRARGLVLFEDRKAEKITRKISKVNTHDRPEIELILHHRTRYLRLKVTVEHAEMAVQSVRKMIEDGQSEYIPALAECIGKVNSIETQCNKHLTAIEDILATLTKEMGSQEIIMARLAADAASLAQKASEHHDKMELARKSSEIPTTAELKERLAIKYGVSVDEVEALMKAKSVDVETGD